MTSTLRDVADLFEVLPDGVIVVDGSGAIAFANAAACRMLGYVTGELTGQPLARLIPQAQRARHESHVAQFRAGGRAGAMGSRPVLSALGKDGSDVPVSISIANIDLRGGRFSVAILRDAAIVREQIRSATAQAHTDALTGLGNRTHLSQCIQEALGADRPFGLLFLDLRNFKKFNDRYSHEVGDEVLRLVAKRIGALVRANDVAVRYGGDEFIVLLDGVVDASLIASRCAALVESLERPFNVAGIADSIGVTIGASIRPRDGDTEKCLIAAADRNMYRARERKLSFEVGGQTDIGD